MSLSAIQGRYEGSRAANSLRVNQSRCTAPPSGQSRKHNQTSINQTDFYPNCVFGNAGTWNCSKPQVWFQSKIDGICTRIKPPNRHDAGEELWLSWESEYSGDMTLNQQNYELFCLVCLSGCLNMQQLFFPRSLYYDTVFICRSIHANSPCRHLLSY